MTDDLWTFGRPLGQPPGTTVRDAEPLLTPAAERELQEQLDDIDRARAAAMRDAGSYVIR